MSLGEQESRRLQAQWAGRSTARAIRIEPRADRDDPRFDPATDDELEYLATHQPHLLTPQERRRYGAD